MNVYTYISTVCRVSVYEYMYKYINEMCTKHFIKNFVPKQKQESA